MSHQSDAIISTRIMSHAIEGVVSQLNQLTLETAEVTETNLAITRGQGQATTIYKSSYQDTLATILQFLIETKYMLQEHVETMTTNRQNAQRTTKLEEQKNL